MASQNFLVDYPKHVRAIGMISIETGDLESALAVLFSFMLQLPVKVGRAIYLTPKSEQARLDVLRAAANTIFAPRPKRRQDSAIEEQKRAALRKVHRIIGRSQTAINGRHRVIHDRWYASPHSDEVLRAKILEGATTESTPVPLAELEDQVEALRKLIDDVDTLATEFRDHPPLMIDMRN